MKNKCFLFECLFVFIMIFSSVSFATECEHKITTTKVITSATCQNKGMKRITCYTCGYMAVKNIDKIACQYNAATCVKAQTCRWCGKTKGSELGHNWKKTDTDVKEVGTEKICTTTTVKQKCSRCGSVKSDSSSDKTHDYKAATCDKVKTCKDCGYKSGKELGHEESKNWSFESAYHYKTCTRCKQKITSTMESHKIDTNGKCVCGYIEKGATCGHPNAKEQIIKQATCSNEGEKRKICPDCGYQSVATKVPKIDHRELRGIVIKSTKPIVINGVSYLYGAHYKQCVECKKKVLVHGLNNNNECTISGCSFGKKECNHVYGDYILDGDKHYRVCRVCNEESPKEEHIIENKVLIQATCTSEGKEEVWCNTCSYKETKITPESHLFTGETGYTNDFQFHYARCKYCTSAISEIGEKHNFNVDTCEACGYICEHKFGLVEENGYQKCNYCNFKSEYMIENCEHNIEFKADLDMHYSVCTKCGYRDMYDSKGRIDSKKYGAHEYDISDLCNGKHGGKCKYCGYLVQSDHIYIAKKDYLYRVCTICKNQEATKILDKISSIEEYTATNEQIKELQEKLFELGYKEVGSADGKMGRKTREAISNFLKDQGFNKVIKENIDITNEIFNLVKACDETKTDVAYRNLLMKYNKDNSSITKDEKILLCQLELDKLGYYDYEKTGTGTKEFEVAVRKFCEMNGIEMPNINKLSIEFINEILNETETYEQAQKNYLSLVLSGNIKIEPSNNSMQRELLQEVLKTLGYYDGEIDGDIGPASKKALNQFLLYQGIELEVDDIDDITDEMFGLIVGCTEKKAEAQIRIRKDKIQELKPIVAEKGPVYFAEQVYGQLYENPKYYDYDKSHIMAIPEWGEKLSTKKVDCTYMGTYYAHEYAGYVGDTALENWTSEFKNSTNWKSLGEAIEEVEKIKNGEITDSKKVNNYNPEEGTYIYGNQKYPVDSFEIIWSVNDNTKITDQKYKAGDIVVERQKKKEGHIEVIREDGSTAVHSAGHETHWDDNGEGIYYTRRSDHSYVLRFKQK